MPDFEQMEKLSVTGLSDHHCHCDYSSDATGTIDEYCEAALHKGLVELCFTTHYDANPVTQGGDNFIRVKGEKKPVTVENLGSYVDEVHAAHDKFFPMGLAVKLGVEFGWYPGCEEEVQKLRTAYPLQHIICGIHELDDLCFCCSQCYEKCFARYSVEEAVQKYYAEVMVAARTGLFSVIAHLDYLRKYGQAHYGDRLNELLEVQAADMFAALVESDTPIEINTAALRKGMAPYYPRIPIINKARRAGVAIQFLGSDAHRPEDVGHDFDAASMLATDLIVSCEG